MELKEIVYNNLNRIISGLTTNGIEFEQYYNGLGDEDKKADLFSLSEDIEAQLKEIKKSKLNGIIHADFDDSLTLLAKFSEKFPDYPNHRIHEGIVIVYLINLLNESIDEEISLEEDYDISQLEITKLTKQIHQRNFAYFDENELKNSIVLLDFSNTARIANYFSQNSIPRQLIIQIIANLGLEASPLETTQYVLGNKDIVANSSQIRSALCVHIVKSGKIIHTPYDYDQLPNISPTRQVNQEVKYQQFDDSILILSEYNHQTDILDKYLRIYHLIENFMYKYPLTELERKYSGDVFSIRDFQRMHDVVSNSELNALKKLFAAICEENYSATQKFTEFINNSWTALYPSVISDKLKVDTLLSLLRIDKNYDSINADQIPSFIAKLVYAFRNSLVHNRETEFHLTHETLLNHSQIENTAQLLLEKFVIPIVEEIVFYLIIEQNNLVWFSNSTIKLFDEN